MDADRFFAAVHALPLSVESRSGKARKEALNKRLLAADAKIVSRLNSEASSLGLSANSSSACLASSPRLRIVLYHAT